MEILSSKNKDLNITEGLDINNNLKTYSSSFIYKQDISRIWEIIKDIKKTSGIFEDFEPKIKFLNGNDSYTQGNEFTLLWKGLYKLNIKVNYYLLRLQK